MKETKSFYKTKKWQRCCNAYRRSVNFICEKCKEKYPRNPEWWNEGEIVHHKIHISKDNMNDESITLNFDNLQLLCRKCHAEEHDEIYGSNRRRWRIDANGNVIIKQ